MGNYWCANDQRARLLASYALTTIDRAYADGLDRILTAARIEHCDVQDVGGQSLLHRFFWQAIGRSMRPAQIAALCAVFLKHNKAFPLREYRSSYRYLGQRRDGSLCFVARDADNESDSDYETDSDDDTDSDNDDTFSACRAAGAQGSEYVQLVDLELPPLMVLDALAAGLPPGQRRIAMLIRSELCARPPAAAVEMAALAAA